MQLYERLIREGGWWDFTDEIATHLVSRVLKKSPKLCWPLLDRWIGADVLWLRRAALLAQLRRKEETDEEKLFEYCLAVSAEEDFFIRKAIGWVLRDYGKTKPERVKYFVAENRDSFSELTVREALRLLE
jgi:3-methyladenine DNA glycosylase AlkD